MIEACLPKYLVNSLLSCSFTVCALLGKATLIFSIECLKLTKQSVFNITDEQKQLLFYVGIAIIGILFIYEMYQRVNKEGKESKKKNKAAREHPNKKGHKRGKNS